MAHNRVAMITPRTITRNRVSSVAFPLWDVVVVAKLVVDVDIVGSSRACVCMCVDDYAIWVSRGDAHARARAATAFTWFSSGSRATAQITRRHEYLRLSSARFSPVARSRSPSSVLLRCVVARGTYRRRDIEYTRIEYRISSVAWKRRVRCATTLRELMRATTPRTRGGISRSTGLRTTAHDPRVGGAVTLRWPLQNEQSPRGFGSRSYSVVSRACNRARLRTRFVAQASDAAWAEIKKFENLRRESSENVHGLLCDFAILSRRFDEVERNF